MIINDGNWGGKPDDRQDDIQGDHASDVDVHRT